MGYGVTTVPFNMEQRQLLNSKTKKNCADDKTLQVGVVALTYFIFPRIGCPAVLLEFAVLF
jgi:hypothetical protein